MSHVATRLLSLILLLQSRRNWKAAQLAIELDVSERTVLRYMAMLDEMGVPVYSERGPYGGFSLVRGYRLPPLLFTPEEATVLYMGAHLVRELWGHTYHEAVTAATAKLDNVLPDDLRQEVASTRQSLVVGGLTAMDYRPWDPTIHLLRQCIVERCCVRLTYRGYSGDETERVLSPYGLTLQWGLWYVVGRCHLRGELRTFRIDRIRHAERLEQRFSMPGDFSVRDYLRQSMRFEPTHQVVVEVEARAAARVREQHGHWMQVSEGESAGTATVRFGTANPDWAVGWVLSLGPAARVLEPPEIVERVRVAAEGIARRYESE